MTKLLHSASETIRTLTNSSSPPTHFGEAKSKPDTAASPSPSDGTDASLLERRKSAFKDAAARYFATLSALDVRLRRQVYALEESGIIPSGPVATKSAAELSATGVNPLDVSWLNSRKDTVWKDKEAELWAEANRLASEHLGMNEGENNDSQSTDAAMIFDVG